MKPIIALPLSVLAAALAAPSPAKNPGRAELAQVHQVYLLPMTNGMDQYLANRLTGLGVFQVVTDPKQADAVLTDQLGEAFESRVVRWFPEPDAQANAGTAPAAAPAAGPPASVAPEKPTAQEKPSAQPAKPGLDDNAADKPDESKGGLKGDTVVPLSSFRRSKGTIFLVNPHTRLVLWSIYAQPKDASAAEMDRTAKRIAEQLKGELKSR
jgi:hypothetical protein